MKNRFTQNKQCLVLLKRHVGSDLETSAVSNSSWFIFFLTLKNCSGKLSSLFISRVGLTNIELVNRTFSI